MFDQNVPVITVAVSTLTFLTAPRIWAIICDLFVASFTWTRRVPQIAVRTKNSHCRFDGQIVGLQTSANWMRFTLSPMPKFSSLIWLINLRSFRPLAPVAIAFIPCWEIDWGSEFFPIVSNHPRKMCASGISGFMESTVDAVVDSVRPEWRVKVALESPTYHRNPKRATPSVQEQGNQMHWTFQLAVPRGSIWQRHLTGPWQQDLVWSSKNWHMMSSSTRTWRWVVLDIICATSPTSFTTPMTSDVQSAYKILPMMASLSICGKFPMGTKL